MKLFQSIQKSFVGLGINTLEVEPVGAKSYMIVFLFVVQLIFNTIFLLNGAKNFEEYASTFYNSEMVIINIVDFSTLIWKTKCLIKFIDDIEEFVEKSE